MDGMCVKTMVLMRPIHLAILAAIRKEVAVTIWAAENTSPSEARSRW